MTRLTDEINNAVAHLRAGGNPIDEEKTSLIVLLSRARNAIEKDAEYIKRSQENDERLCEELKQLRDANERTLTDLRKAVSFLHACKRQFAPHTTNSEVDTFIAQMEYFS